MGHRPTMLGDLRVGAGFRATTTVATRTTVGSAMNARRASGNRQARGCRGGRDTAARLEMVKSVHEGGVTVLRQQAERSNMS